MIVLERSSHESGRSAAQLSAARFYTQRLDQGCQPEYLLQSAILRAILATYMPRPRTNGSQSTLRIDTHSFEQKLSTYRPATCHFKGWSRSKTGETRLPQSLGMRGKCRLASYWRVAACFLCTAGCSARYHGIYSCT